MKEYSIKLNDDFFEIRFTAEPTKHKADTHVGDYYFYELDENSAICEIKVLLGNEYVTGFDDEEMIIFISQNFELAEER